MSSEKAEIERLYKEAESITKYQIIDKWSSAITGALFGGSIGAYIGETIGGYGLTGALIGAWLIFGFARPREVRKMFEKNLEKIMKKYDHA